MQNIHTLSAIGSLVLDVSWVLFADDGLFFLGYGVFSVLGIETVANSKQYWKRYQKGTRNVLQKHHTQNITSQRLHCVATCLQQIYDSESSSILQLEKLHSPRSLIHGEHVCSIHHTHEQQQQQGPGLPKSCRRFSSPRCPGGEAHGGHDQATVGEEAQAARNLGGQCLETA